MEIKKASSVYYSNLDLGDERYESIEVKVNNEWENNIKLKTFKCWRSIEEEIEFHENIIVFLNELKEKLKEA